MLNGQQPATALMACEHPSTVMLSGSWLYLQHVPYEQCRNGPQAVLHHTQRQLSLVHCRSHSAGCNGLGIEWYPLTQIALSYNAAQREPSKEARTVCAITSHWHVCLQSNHNNHTTPTMVQRLPISPSGVTEPGLYLGGQICQL